MTTEELLLDTKLTLPSSDPDRALLRRSLGFLDIDLHTEPALIREVVEHALHGNETRQIATVNAQFYVLAEKSQSFRECLKRVEYLCADGMPIVWACRLFVGEQVPRIAGVDLIGRLCRAGAPHKLRVFLLGGRPGAATETGEILRKSYPGLEIAGVSCPRWGFHENPAELQQVLEEVAAAKPNILFIAFGAPKQELFIERHIRTLRVPVAVGIGGSFEILSGKVQRAPEWVQTMGLEWAYRFCQEPGRLWKRYLLGNLAFLWCVAKWRYKVHAAAGAIG